MNSRGRKKKVRYIQEMPKVSQFSPRGRSGRPDAVELTIDQFEAIRLADLQGYHQVEAAQFMGLSRPSFGRILKGARQVIASALVNGKTLYIRISNVQVGVTRKILPHKISFRSGTQAKRKEDQIRQSILKYSK